MRTWWLTVLIVAWPALCFAQNAQQPAPPAAPAAPAAEAGEAETPTAPKYVTHECLDFGFSVALPASGEFADPSSEGWNGSAGTAFYWFGAAGDPLTLMLGVSTLHEQDVTPEVFQSFCDEMIYGWAKQADNPPEGFGTASAGGPGEGMPGVVPFHFITAGEPRVVAEREWKLIEIADYTKVKNGTVYYSVYSTFAGRRIYTLSFYYLTPADDAIRAFFLPVLESFKPLQETPPAP